eukprot:15708873-Heterocapsa_arctica.AAC.1
MIVVVAVVVVVAAAAAAAAVGSRGLRAEAGPGGLRRQDAVVHGVRKAHAAYFRIFLGFSQDCLR